MVTKHFFPQVNECVAHAAQCGVDAHPGAVGNFLEAHLQVMAHNQHLLLLGGQFFNVTAQPAAVILPHLPVFHRYIGKLQGVHQAAAVFEHNFGVPFFLAEVVNGQVVGNAAYPR